MQHNNKPNYFFNDGARQNNVEKIVPSGRCKHAPAIELHQLQYLKDCSMTGDVLETFPTFAKSH